MTHDALNSPAAPGPGTPSVVGKVTSGELDSVVVPALGAAVAHELLEPVPAGPARER
ncbi:hypothetical protein LWC35_06050 [Pseudonocardia kujensis]|uniref:hypothetical protein n=1 Tax=Pseudonocardia kujensis TaxID=1128675 RepID=UPI001E496A1D|nr:hypothetical protein [Pseudonocardia kujensis]MCE0762473.1 hypothetical protein [Pseudonocardia kujensis]